MLYPKIQTLFKRTEKSELILGDWTEPYFEYLAGNLWRLTEKIDGTNIRVEISPVEEKTEGQDTSWVRVRFDGRTDNAALPAPLVNWLVEKFLSDRTKSTLKEKFPDGATLFGEGYGAGIGKGGKYSPHQSFILFDVRVGDWWLQHHDVLDVAQTLELDMVPVVGETTLFDAIDLVRQGMKSRFGSFEAEGIVAQPVLPLCARDGSRIITKLKTRDFQKVVEKE